MKNKLIYLTLTISIFVCLVGCKREDAANWIYEYELQEDNTYKILEAQANRNAINQISDIYIPLTYKGKKITTIGASAFMNNVYFTDGWYPNLYIGENITKIEENAFNGLPVGNIEIKENVEVIEANAFYRCCRSNVYCFAESKPIGWSNDTGIDERTYIFNYFEKRSNDLFDYAVLKDNKIVITKAKPSALNEHITIPATIDDMEVIRITGGTFRYMNASLFDIFRVQEVTLPETITALEYGLLTGLFNLKTINFSSENRITKIEESALDCCTDLESFVIKNEVLEIGENAFSRCWMLTIYVEAESKPDGWSDNWNPDNRPVVWGYTGE